jgi:RNA polymerase sigma factor (sigma-70 family)
VKDYEVVVRVRNNWFLTKVRDSGFATLADLSRASGIPNSSLGNIANLRVPALDAFGKWRSYVSAVADFLGCMPEELYPPQHLKDPLKKNRVAFHANLEELESIAALGSSLRTLAIPAEETMIREQAATSVRLALGALPPRLERLLRLRWGFDGEEKTFEEIAQLWGLSRGRVQQMEAKALRMLKHPSKGRVLREAIEPLGCGERYHGKPEERHYRVNWDRSDGLGSLLTVKEAGDEADCVDREPVAGSAAAP